MRLSHFIYGYAAYDAGFRLTASKASRSKPLTLAQCANGIKF